MLDTVARDIHPPLWFVAAKGWMALGGDCERWLKSLPVLASLAGIAGTFALARRLADARAGLFAALLLALNTAHLRWSQQFEDYALLWGLLPWMLLAAWSLRERPRPLAAALTLTLAPAALYTDYLVAFVLVPIVAWGAVTLRGDRRALAWWLGTFAAVALAFSPQAPVWAAQWAREGHGAHFRWTTPAELVRLARVIGFGPWWVALVAGALAAAALARPATRRGALFLLAACAPAPFVTRAWPLVAGRDLLYLLPLAYALIALGLSGIPGRVARLAPLALLLAFAARRISAVEPWAEPRALGRTEIRLRTLTVPGSLLLHAEPHSWLYFEYHMPSRRNRLLAPPGERVPYFDFGLAIPDSAYWTPRDWRAHAAAGGPWAALHVDRAFVQYGIARRAGTWARARFDSASVREIVSDPPVRVWIGAPAAPGARSREVEPDASGGP